MSGPGEYLPDPTEGITNPEDLPKAKQQEALGSFRHSITNHNYTFTVAKATLARAASRFEWVERTDLKRLPLSTTTRKAFALLGQTIKQI